MRPALAVADARDGTTTTRSLSELGNARRLLDQHGEILRYVPDVAGWLVWRDNSWQWDTGGSFVREMAATLPNKIYAEGSAFSMDQATHFAKHARNSEKAHFINAAVSLLSDHSVIRLPISMIDANPMLAGFDDARQVIDLRTGQARPC